MRACHIASAALLGISGALAAQTVAFPPALEVRVPKAPAVTRGAGESILPYELHITNFTGQPITLQRVDVLDADRGTTLATLSDSALLRALARPSMRVPMAERAHIAPGLRAVVFMWVPLAGAPPHAIRHRATSVADTGRTTPLVLETPAVPVSSDVVVSSPPLRGGVWLAANGPAAESGHRRALVPVDAACSSHSGSPSIG